MIYKPQNLLLAVLLLAICVLQSVVCGHDMMGPHRDNPHQIPFHETNGNVSLSRIWQILGPFRSGTRGCGPEAIWGADPLEYYGGFSNLSYNTDATFSSALALNGTARWSLVRADISSISRSTTKASLNVSFPEVDWTHLQSVYGWAALQYQAWARGSLDVRQPNGQTIALYMSGLLEFLVDGKRHFGGDFYSYHRAPVILHLPQGQHTLDLRLTRDVRALGAAAEPKIGVEVEAEERQMSLNIDSGSLLVSDITQGKLGNSWASINVQNNLAEWVEIVSLSSPDAPQYELDMESLRLSPYQIRPLVFTISVDSPLKLDFSVDIIYKRNTEKGEVLGTLPFQVKLVEKSLLEAQKFTFLHPAKIVSYSILRPPPLTSICGVHKGRNTVPVMIAFHGAGLQADAPLVRGMLDAANYVCSWKLLPTGVTPWSGDDWHIWGTSDVQAAIAAIPEWIRNVNWQGPHAAVDDWIITGHSNGGQGVWYFSTHYPDQIIAAAPVSGYSSIENYVPYSMWHDSDPLVSTVLQRSRSSYKHELLLENAAGIPILQQHGSNDDNVPVYHSRLMHELLERIQWPSQYNELPGKGHWFEGIMTTSSLLGFYEEKAISQYRPKMPLSFIINIPSSGTMGSVYGIYVDQLQSPDMNGKIEVTRDLKNGVWYLQTQNIHRFRLSVSTRVEVPVALVLDKMEHPFIVDPSLCEKTWYLKGPLNQWVVSNKTEWKNIYQRHGHQMGAMDAILRSNGTFTIFTCSAGAEHVALQISRNLLQYFAADSLIVEKCSSIASFLDRPSKNRTGNVIVLAVGDDLPPSKNPAFPIRVYRGNLVLSDACSSPHSAHEAGLDSERVQKYVSEYTYRKGLGALFLRPLENERLELIVWGVDLHGLEQAARLVPTLTGVGQPDFIVLSDSCRWKGHGGLFAAGHFNKFWQISPGSFLSRGSGTYGPCLL